MLILSFSCLVEEFAAAFQLNCVNVDSAEETDKAILYFIYRYPHLFTVINVDRLSFRVDINEAQSA
jgi:hypothetical protein